MTYVQIFGRLFGAMAALILLSYFLLPGARGWLRWEDSLVENLSAAVFLLTAGLGLWLFLRSEPRTWSLLVLASASLVGFLDEISFGQRLLGFEPPRLYGVPLDGVHDLADVGYVLAERAVASRPRELLLLSTISTPIGLLWLVRRRRAWQGSLSRAARRPPFVLASACAACLGLATLLDLFGEHPLLKTIEEGCELMAGVALAFCALSLRPAPSSPSDTPARSS